ncbi:MAG: metallophosphoesterase, partial [Peptoniphilaceae bacterium]|nr:metallophosphoesterase [Peptoniphilaceae bacterium]
GWVNEENNEFDEHDLKIYDREINRLKNSLNYINSDLEKIVMFHYPPFSYHEGKFNDFFELLKGKNVKYVIYGHLHGNGHKFVKEGDFFGIKLYCVSSDYLKFIPKKLK